jgi:hypothetical protein
MAGEAGRGLAGLGAARQGMAGMELKKYHPRVCGDSVLRR